MGPLSMVASLFAPSQLTTTLVSYTMDVTNAAREQRQVATGTGFFN